MERETEAQQFKRRKNKDSQTTRITSLNQELADLNQQKKVGLISTAEHKAIRQPLVEELHRIMQASGRKPIRTKTKSDPHRTILICNLKAKRYIISTIYESGKKITTSRIFKTIFLGCSI